MKKLALPGATVRRIVANRNLADRSNYQLAWIKGGRRHDFGWIADVYGPQLVDRLVDAAKVAYGDMKPVSTIQQFHILKNFLSFVACMFEYKGSNPSFKKVFAALAGYDGIYPEAFDWVVVVEEFSEEVLENNFGTYNYDQSIASIANNIQSFNTLRKRLFPEMGWADSTQYASAPSPEWSKSRAALGELKKPGKKTDNRAPNEISATRLAALRSACEELLLLAKERFDSKRHIIEKVKAEFYAPYRHALLTCKSWREFKNLGLSVLNADELLGICLKYFDEFGGNDRGILYRSVLTRISPIPVVDLLEYFEGRMDAQLAASVIIMVDTGINPEVCATLVCEPIIGRAKAGKVEIATLSGTKDRAKYAHIKAVIDVHTDEARTFLSATRASNKLSGYEALRIWQELSRPVRTRARDAGNELASGLWITQAAKTQNFRSANEGAEWKRFLHNIWGISKELRGLHFTKANIRSSLIQQKFFRFGGDAQPVAMFADHKSAATTMNKYLRSPHVRRFLDSFIIDYQGQYESIFETAKRRAKQLFLTEGEFLNRRAQAMRNGLGFLCGNPESGIQPDTKGQTCWKIEACTDCPLLQFYPGEESVTELLWFRASLEKVDASFRSMNPERWVQIWLPALALCDATLELLASSHHRVTLNSATEGFKRDLEAGVNRYFTPW